MVPVIRAAALVPLLRVLVERERPVEAMLGRAGIGYLWVDEPYAVVPIRALERFLIEVASLEGPDIGARSIKSESLSDLAALGMAMLAARTPRASLNRVILAMPHHCSHEIISLAKGAESTEFRDYWNLPLHPEAAHIIQQTVAAILQTLLALARPGEPVVERIEMQPHPVFGLDHLKPWFEAEIVPAPRPYLAVTIPNEVLDTRYRFAARAAPPETERTEFTRLTDLSMSESIRQVLAAVLSDGSPTIQHVAGISDMSVRSLQRRLAEEDVTFSDLVEEVRREAAMKAVAGSDLTLGDVAANLGYAKQSSLTRAFRRWLGQPPSTLRSQGSGDGEE
jgi:AraC-like DNA-binding protein